MPITKVNALSVLFRGTKANVIIDAKHLVLRASNVTLHSYSPLQVTNMMAASILCGLSGLHTISFMLHNQPHVWHEHRMNVKRTY